ncbi:MAG: helix-turn-helix domain-containing protein [Treponema sp.]|nr:helix-turn-helix domain-containing protein [Treponema sp.]
MKNRISLDLEQPEKASALFRALSSPVRLRMLKVIGEKPGINISAIGEKLSLPLSTTALHVRVLEDTGLILIQEKPGLRGCQKSCAVLVEDINVNVFPRWRSDRHTREIKIDMPLGNYFDCAITKPCGMAGRSSYVGTEDDINAFFDPDRIHAQLVWFTSGFLEYRFPNAAIKDENIQELSFSFEACSEAAGYNNDWPSDITVWINSTEVFTFRSPGDFGGKRGANNPDWWPDESTQYGELHRLEISAAGCFGDRQKACKANLDSLRVVEGDYVSFKIGIKKDAKYAGGINLFGEYFGNYKQGIEMIARVER